MTGRLAIVGLGPGAAELVTPLASETLAAATDLVGYAPYLARVPERAGQRRHASDNREELARAKQALDLAAAGRSVAVVSSGDPGVFAMASAVFEAIETGTQAWNDIEVIVVPGVSAMLAAAARIGAPLGHDFCVISLSDNLKPWDLVLKRLEAAASGDFIIVLYNPASKARPWQLGDAFRLIARHRPGSTLVIFAHAVSRPDERIDITTLAGADAAQSRHAHAHYYRLERDEARFRRQRKAFRLHAPSRGACRVMSPLEPEKRIGDGLDGRRLRQIRARDHDHGQRQRPRRVELGGGARAARVLGDDHFDSMRLEQCVLVRDVERSACGDQLNKRRQFLRRGHLDAAHNIEMLWRFPERRELHATSGEKDAARVSPNRCRSRLEAFHHDPAIAIAWAPGRAANGEQRHVGRVSSLDGIRLHLHGEGMRRVDEKIEVLLGQNARQTLLTAEAAGPQRARKPRWVSSPAGERQGDVVARVAVKRAGEVSGLAAAAENEKLQRLSCR